MTYQEIINKISRDRALNPFNDTFSIEDVKKYLSIELVDEDKINTSSLLMYNLLANDKYSEFCENLKKILKTDIEISNYLLSSIIIANLDCLKINEELTDSLENIETFSTVLIDSIRRKNFTQERNYFDLNDAVIDLLDFNFNLILYCCNYKVKYRKIIVETSLSSFDSKYRAFFLYSSYFSFLKTLYNKICFEDNRVAIDDSKNMIFYHNELDLYKAVSHHRMMNNLMFFSQTVSSKKELKEIYSRNYTSLDIQEIIFVKGYGKIKYSHSENSVVHYSIHFNSALGFYFFHLPSEKKREIEETIIVFSCLQYLVTKILEYFRNSNIDQSFNINELQLRFKKSTIFQMIRRLTFLSIPKISKYLNLFENDGKKSFWFYPILRLREDYLIALGPLNSTNPCILIDLWAKRLFNHDNEKGNEFELYIRKEIDRMCNEKGFFSKVHEQKNFKAQGKKEEIDLIWETKHTIVIGEIKCIQYPFDSRNIFDYTEVIHKAVKQVIKKYKFLLENKESFTSFPFEKKIKICVITNYPFLTGYNIDDVSVLDIGVLTQYIALGYDAYGISNGSNFESKKQTIFYNNEDDFSNNIITYFETISMIERYKEGFELISQKIPLTNGYTATTVEYRWNKEHEILSI